MTYPQVIEYLYNATPQFQRIGAAAYKPGLDTIVGLATKFGNPHLKYPVIHIAGTNGKGSTSHTLAAILQSAGYKTGLFTSPHLIDFRERIRVNGTMISQEEVCRWMDRYLSLKTSEEPSFFELTTLMAFDYFADMNVEVAVVEVGLGGRLDSTNIVQPILSVITNISKDHVAQLGNDPVMIAGEKAGIIKPATPVILGEGNDVNIRAVFEKKATDMDAPLTVASDNPLFSGTKSIDNDTYLELTGTPFGTLRYQLTGNYQEANANTVLHALAALQGMGWDINNEAVAAGFARVCDLTGLMGRWTRIQKSPTVVCDTGHNEGGWRYIAKRLGTVGQPLRMIIGFVNDKDVDTVLAMMPRDATYYFTQASVPRALDSKLLQTKASHHGLKGETYSTVKEAYKAAVDQADTNDFIFVGGSTFVVADLLTFIGDNQATAGTSL